MRQVLAYALGGDPSLIQHRKVTGKNVFSSVANKVRSLRNKVMAFLAPGEQIALAIA